ncbi:MAG TPA: LON peptidase substrate-binding domain-containing protein [Rhabdaerophilum sp.]|nr:LON peptidase substrate-binding domain-containing protein [Rhabdaerophilum sp.]
MPSNMHYSRISDLPGTLALFPLPGALLLPRGQMPLNIFEPRYMAMVDAALAGSRLIGMIQPDPAHSKDIALPPLYSVGCAGRITQLAETGDGRYLIQLTGVARFRLVEEIPAATLFRQARVDFGPFAGDLEARSGEEQVNREAVLAALRAFSEAHAIEIDWKSIDEAANEALVNALSMMAPFGVAEKQALLAAADLKARADMLVALTEMELAREGGDGGPAVQ